MNMLKSFKWLLFHSFRDSVNLYCLAEDDPFVDEHVHKVNIVKKNTCSNIAFLTLDIHTYYTVSVTSILLYFSSLPYRRDDVTQQTKVPV